MEQLTSDQPVPFSPFNVLITYLILAIIYDVHSVTLFGQVSWPYYQSQLLINRT